MFSLGRTVFFIIFLNVPKQVNLMKNYPKVLVIIVTWNKKDYVINLLDSLLDMDYPKEAMEILVVDNASTDGTAEAIKARKDNINIICNRENLGGTGGFNTGLSWAFSQPAEKYDYLWLLDNDVLVHKHALSALVQILSKHSDVAVAGSTMMQLDYPWKINEMGAGVDLEHGRLKLNRHFQEIDSWKNIPVERLRSQDIDISLQLDNCPKWMKVDYVAAASLLIRSHVARKAGLWEDYFLHFDDVEWCLRIAKMGEKVVVSAQSIIWHLSAFSKVPSWVLYYDNRNVLYLLEKHGTPGSISKTRRWIQMKSLYYAVLGKFDLSKLHIEALRDYRLRVMGKKNIQLDEGYGKLNEIEKTLSDPSIKQVLIPWTLEDSAPALLQAFRRVANNKSAPNIDVLLSPYLQTAPRLAELATADPMVLPKNRVLRLIKYFLLRGRYDLVLQSDYQPVPALSWVGGKVLFTNNEYFSIRDRPRISQVFKTLWEAIRS